MQIKGLVMAISKVIERGMCDHLTDENLNQTIAESSLRFALPFYKNYVQTANILNIKPSYLNYLISKNKTEVGNPFHDPILGKNNWLSVYQIQKLERILKNNNDLHFIY